MEEQIYQKLRRYRTQNSLTQQQVAEQLDVTRQAVTKWETGESLPSTANLLALAKLYNVPLSALTGEPPQELDEQEEQPQEQDEQEEQPPEKTFWTIEKEAFFVFLVGILFVIVYFSAHLFGANPSMTLFVCIQLPIFTVSTVIACVSDERIHTKSGFWDILLPLVFTLGVQILIGIICEV